ncbi:MAG: adenosylcobalamin-dependent ribonucleoside-diphosphate reductase [Xanthobacteraceae bacterium]
MSDNYGPQTEIGRTINALKHRAPDESYDDACVRYARAVADDEAHFRKILKYRRDMLLLPAGRQQLAVGRPHQITAFNCFVMGEIADDTASIYDANKYAALTMRMGGGVGMDFSTLRPLGDPIRGLGSGAFSSGPVSFMGIWNAMCETMMSAGSRRGAMMATLRVDHPDILRFVNAKRIEGALKNFNISAWITDSFMEALYADGLYPLTFGGTKYGDARAVDVWARIMESNWDWAEPGVLFGDRINRLNPLYYCETIAATNPCAEEPLPPYGCCLLGSLNIVKALRQAHDTGKWEIDLHLLYDATECAVRAFDNVIDASIYPLPEQAEAERLTRRMGIGVTGMANALEIMGLPYGSAEYLDMQDEVLMTIRDAAYYASIGIAERKGSFPLFDADRYLAGEFAKTLPEDIKDRIRIKGLRNSHLLAIAPCGTISLAADNVSSGIEPVFQLRGMRDVLTPDGKQSMMVRDYALEMFGIEGRTADQISPQEHIDVLCRAQRWEDTSISKTCNVNGQIGGQGPGITFSQFKDLYLRAWEGGAKSCTTFNINGKRMGIMRPAADDEGAACVFDSATGMRSCE